MTKRDCFLDLLRSILALLVVSEHLRHCIFLPFAEQEVLNLRSCDQLFFGLSSLGKQSVLGFFCLSGYFIAFSLKSLSSSVSSPAALFKTFALKRLTRIYTLFLPMMFVSIPIYYFSLFFNPGLHETLSSFGFGGAFLGDSTNISAFVPTLLLSPGLFGKGVWEGFPISWSLVNEVWYYFSAFTIFFFLANIWKYSFSAIGIFFSVSAVIGILGLQLILGVLNYFPYFLAAFVVGWFKYDSFLGNSLPSSKDFNLRGTISLLAIIFAPFVFIVAEKLFPSLQSLVVASWVIVILVITPGASFFPPAGISVFLVSCFKAFSDHSYSLYLSHSLLVVGVFGAFRFSQMPVSAFAYLLFFVFIVISYFLAWPLFKYIDSRHYLAFNALLGR